MSNKKVSTTTIVISNLDKQEAVSIASSLKEAKQSIAGKSKASVVIGEKNVFASLMAKCNKLLER